MFGPPRWLNVKLMCAVLSWRVGTGGATVSQSKVSVKVSSKWPLSSGAAVAGVLASTVHVMPSPAMSSAERRLMVLMTVPFVVGVISFPSTLGAFESPRIRAVPGSVVTPGLVLVASDRCCDLNWSAQHLVKFL